MKMLAAMFLPMFFVGAAYADEASDLAKNIGFCEATNTVFININETAAYTFHSFEQMVPLEDRKQFHSAGIMFHRTAMLQKIQNDTLEATIPEMLTAFPNIDKKQFYSKKDAAYETQIVLLLTEMRKIDPIDKEKFGIQLEKDIEFCLSEYPPAGGYL